MEINEIQVMIDEYNDGLSFREIAKKHSTYPNFVRRTLKKCKVELRHDTFSKGTLHVKDGDILLEWAKKQGRLVTKAELANVLGKKRLSPSYFLKYPELGQYVKTYEQKDVQEYTQKLYDWLKENDIIYKPNDRTKLGLSVHALLLGQYSGLAIDIFIKPRSMSKKHYEELTKQKMDRAKDNGVIILFLNEEHFEDLNSIKGLLDSLIVNCIKEK